VSAVQRPYSLVCVSDCASWPDGDIVRVVLPVAVHCDYNVL